MSVLGINAAKNISFGYNPYKNNSKLVSIKQYPDFEERKYEIPASTGKKWGVGIASFCITGLGQAINGEWGKAAGFFFGSIAAGFAGGLVAAVSGVRAAKLAGLLVSLGVGIWSVVDAVKNAKTEEVHIIPRNIQSDNSSEIDTVA